MVVEAHFENSIVNYFVEELGYTKEDPCIFNGDSMLIPTVVEQFIYNNHESICKNIIRKDYNGDRKAFFSELIKELSDYVYGSFNVAVQLNRWEFKFKGHNFKLYFPVSHDRHTQRNIFSVMQQPSFTMHCVDGKYKVIPDIGIFVNGFLFSYIQLKLPHRGQTAASQGRGQVIGDYIEAVKRCVTDVIATNDILYNITEEKTKLVNKVLKYFHAPTSIVAMDMNSAFVIRGLSKTYSDVEKFCFTNNANDGVIKEDLLKTFLLDSLYTKEDYLPVDEKAKRFLTNLYSKTSIQNEILYFNFIAYEKRSEFKNGKKEVVNKNNSAALNFPRPNQKYGVEKAIKEIVRKYQNETNPNYEIERLVRKLDSLHVPDNVRKQVIEKRMSYNNNKNQFSLLLQYAAGFGKTYILCWLALMLKDLENISTVEKNDYLFDKILIISDRVDLRDQVDRSMHNMNIEKELFKEADNKDVLKACLSESGPRIIIVNIQKFTHLQDILGEEEKGLLNGKRVAFLIDEIHRSNSGTHHASMTDLFSEVTEALSGNDDKKNLVIGLTATPTDENLARFGEYQGCTDGLRWLPFDSYTMSEAISDGFVLDPTKNLVPFAVKMGFAEDDKKKLPTKKDIYESKTRIETNAKNIAKILVDTTFKKIKGHGKAMLACYSIDSAKIYYDTLKEELKALTELPKYSQYKDSGIFMVYSATQETIPAHSTCGYSSEKEVINAFKNNRWGVMIVVDKLQTGFDEPKLHTLILDKEISEINAVQTVCRVNRTTRGKEDCLVVDFSIDNRNMSNIREAFHKYAGIVVSDLDSSGIKRNIEDLYNQILRTNYYRTFFERYKLDPSDMQLAYDVQQYVDNAFLNVISEEAAISMGESFLNYINKLGMIKSIIDIKDMYKDGVFIQFLTEYLNLIRAKLDNSSGSKFTEILDFWVETSGNIESGAILIDEIKKKQIIDAKLRKSSTGEFNILAKIREMNENEANKELLIEDFKKKLKVFFEKIIDMDQKNNDGMLVLKMKDYQNSQTRNEEFTRCFNDAIRRLKHTTYMQSFVESIQGSELMIESDFYKYVLTKDLEDAPLDVE